MKNRNSVNNLILAVFVVCLAGCAGIETPPRPVVAPHGGSSGEYGDGAPGMERDGGAQFASQKNDGSLFSQRAAAHWSPWRDDTANRVGDIVTVRISIDNNAEKSASTGLTRESKVGANISALFGYENSLPFVKKEGADSSGTSGTAASSAASTSANQPLVATTSSSDFQGEGDTKRVGKMTADISAIITHVYPNGNMSLHGSQALLINNETSLLTVDGDVRASDVSVDNVVISDRIANARIEITGRGVISDKQRPGIGMRVFDWVWPF